MDNKQQILSGNVSIQAIEDLVNRNSNVDTGMNKSTFDEKNYLNLKLNPGETSRKVQIRILPVSETNSNFCVVIKTHSVKLSKHIAKSGFKVFPCLNDANVKEHDNKGCPLCNKAQEYFNEAKKARENGDEALSKTLFKTACGFLSKETYIVRVIERGKESEGVKFWRFNANTQKKGYFDKLIALYKTRKEEYQQAGVDDNYNIFDLNNGKDIILTLSKATRADGKDSVSIEMTDASIATPLSKDIEQANEWIRDPKTWKDAYAVKNYEYLEIIADGKIPVRDKISGLYIGKSEDEFKSKDEVVTVKEIESEIKKEMEVVQQKVAVEVNKISPQIEKFDIDDTDDDELPF